MRGTSIIELSKKMFNCYNYKTLEQSSAFISVSPNEENVWYANNEVDRTFNYWLKRAQNYEGRQWALIKGELNTHSNISNKTGIKNIYFIIIQNREKVRS